MVDGEIPIIDMYKKDMKNKRHKNLLKVNK